ncbi:glyoxalase/bleomycin resistance protein/dioxygenase [Crucibulum laeve]|uniref:Glyoxalase/bleomycin resistance protein/dioxygenase n=1 Tax=Crucibulum laeve TaxID=68775 RepID=A0A5C3LGJ6_9AGAR|nr:glyoxalase/bleomycin resistance protein/dioxygenase [Crucibulum laeve]
MVLNHVQFVVSSLLESKKFYLAALAPLGYEEYYAVEGVVVGLRANGVPDLWLGAVKGPDDSPTKGLHLAFAGESRDVVDQFYEAALKAGAKDNGAPGVRNYIPGYYAAYVLDLDGNNIEVMHV